MSSSANARPHVLLKSAATLDGCIDDTAAGRLVISSSEDRLEVDRLRAESDAILIGGETLRRDNPRLQVKAPEHVRARKAAGRSEQPLKVVVSTSGTLPIGADFFALEGAEKRVYVPAPSVDATRAALGDAASVRGAGMGPVDLSLVLDDLYASGIRSLLVEAGTRLAGSFMRAGLVDVLRLAVSPRILAQPEAPRLAFGTLPSKIRLQSTERLGDMVVLTYSLS